MVVYGILTTQKYQYYWVAYVSIYFLLNVTVK